MAQRTRRLPTKSQSGRFTLPQAPVVDIDDDELGLASELSSSFLRPALVQPSTAEQQEPLVQHKVHSELAGAADEATSDSGSSICASVSKCSSVSTTTSSVTSLDAEQPADVPGSQQQAPACAQPVVHIAAPAPPKKPAPPSRSRGPTIHTGPLNQSSTPLAHALPVKRRGSYQSLKRRAAPAGNSSSGDQLDIVALLEKSTHWERFGTIMVLYCCQDKCNSDRIMQMIMAEGYDTMVEDNHADAIKAFSASDVFPDLVIIDADSTSFNALQLLKQFHATNPGVVVVVIGNAESRPNAVTALQNGAADFLRKPMDEEELVARIERHVQRQHAIKLELERVMEQARITMSQLTVAMAQQPAGGGQPSQSAKRGGLGSVAETDFEEQMGELSDENQRLGAKLQEMERLLEQKLHENVRLLSKLNTIETQPRAHDIQDEHMHDAAQQDQHMQHHQDGMSLGAGALSG